MAPPRLVPETGLIDTLQVFNNLSYQAQSTSFFVNPYAAMPSLHVGWAVLLAIGVWLAFPDNRLVRRWRLHPLTQWASTVVTGNHFWLDGVGGLVAAAIGLAFAHRDAALGLCRSARRGQEKDAPSSLTGRPRLSVG